MYIYQVSRLGLHPVTLGTSAYDAPTPAQLSSILDAPAHILHSCSVEDSE